MDSLARILTPGVLGLLFASLAACSHCPASSSPASSNGPVWRGTIEHAESISDEEKAAVEVMMQRLVAATPASANLGGVTIKLVDAPEVFRFTSSPGTIRVGRQGLQALLEDPDEFFGPSAGRQSALAFALAHELGHLANVGAGLNHAQVERAIDDFAIRLARRARYDANPGIIATLAVVYWGQVRHGGSNEKVLNGVVSYADLQLRSYSFNPWVTTREELCEVLRMVPKDEATLAGSMIYAMKTLIDEPEPGFVEPDWSAPPPPSLAANLQRSAAIHAAYPIDCSVVRTR